VWTPQQRPAAGRCARCVIPDHRYRRPVRHRRSSHLLFLQSPSAPVPSFHLSCDRRAGHLARRPGSSNSPRRSIRPTIRIAWPFQVSFAPAQDDTAVPVFEPRPRQHYHRVVVVGIVQNRVLFPRRTPPEETRFSAEAINRAPRGSTLPDHRDDVDGRSATRSTTRSEETELVPALGSRRSRGRARVPYGGAVLRVPSCNPS